MRLIITSDTHGNTGVLEKLTGFLKADDFLVHLGDFTRDFEKIQPQLTEKGIRNANVNGNCDYHGPGPYKKIVLSGKSIGLVHGHLQGVNSTLVTLDLFAQEKELDVILFGHTHISKIEYGSTGILMMNPGSMSEPRLGKASFGVIVIEDGILKPRIVTVDDMERYFEYQTEDTGDTEN